MSESDVIIRAENLSKIYRLYTKPHYRFLDMFGLLHKPNAYTEHSALRGVDLKIRRGEKVAFIGRNGAGKSTLLKLITGVVEPTSGTLEVSQGAHALLQIGSGFHPDFTGRQNALAYLAHLGVSDRKAGGRLREIVEFAELEEYIDQPIKTYSTGMVARLMFATSTVIEPELLVLDEILGVGDAYFSQKSFERIREMCESKGTTVLLVSHDIYSAAKLCERMIWIDRGQVVFDGSTRDAMLAYETSIREQEETRLRAKRMISASEDGGARPAAERDGREQVLVEIAPADALLHPVRFGAIEVFTQGQWQVQIPVVEVADLSAATGAQLVVEESNWGDVAVDAEHGPYREMRTFGSPYNKVAFQFRLPRAGDGAALPCIRCSYRSAVGCTLQVTWFDSDRSPAYVGDLPSTDGHWVSDRVIELAPCRAVATRFAGRAIGTQRIQVRDARFVTDAGDETHFVEHGAPARLCIDYTINDPYLDESPQIVVAVHRDGSFDTCRYICRDLNLNGKHSPLGTIDFRIDRMPLSNGRYTVTVLVARPGYYDEDQTQYFTINPGVYACRSRMFEFEVTGGRTFVAGTVFIGEAQWSLRNPP
jgi:ABC-type polysaccharide/polyol phosphate transport system ATPase subunit